MRELNKQEIKEISGGCGLLGSIISFKIGLITSVIGGLFGRCKPAPKPDPCGCSRESKC